MFKKILFRIHILCFFFHSNIFFQNFCRTFKKLPGEKMIFSSLSMSCAELTKDNEGLPLADELRMVGSFPYLERGVCGEFIFGIELGLSIQADTGLLLQRGFESGLAPVAAPDVKRSTMSSRQKMASSLIAYSSPNDVIIMYQLFQNSLYEPFR